MAPRDIRPGKEYGEVIDQAISQASVFILVFSQDSLNSNWVRKETNLAVSDSKIIIPFRIEECSLTGSMRTYLNDVHWIDAVPDPDEAFGRLAKAVSNSLGRSSSDQQKSPDTNENGQTDQNEEILLLKQQLAEEKKEVEQLKKQKEDETTISSRKRIVFLVLGVIFGFLGLHFLYVHRFILFAVTLGLFISAIVFNSSNLAAYLWLAAIISAFIFSKDGNRKKMRWF